MRHPDAHTRVSIALSIFAAAVLSLAGCMALTGPATEPVEGMSIAEVQEVYGSDGIQWPNLSGDSRTMIEFKLDGDEGPSTMAAFEGGEFIAAKEVRLP